MPLILYCYKIYKKHLNNNTYPYDEIYDIVKRESSVTHYNQVIFHSNMAYCVAGLYLLDNYNETDRNKKAYFLAKNWLFEQLKKYDLESDQQNEFDNNEMDEEDTLEIKIACCTEVLEWLFNACENENENDSNYYFSPTTKI
eukprot:339284_1